MECGRRVILAVECDFRGYRPYDGGCVYDHAQSLQDVAAVVDFVAEAAGGKAAFLVHTSPFVRREHGDPFYTNRDYIDLWRKAVRAGGEVGLHPHEEEPDGSCFYYHYGSHMSRVMEEHAQLLRAEGLPLTSQMIGYCGMNEWITPIVEDIGVYVSLNNVGEYVSWSHSNWKDAPPNPYFHSYDDVCGPGESHVLEIPLGTTDLMRFEDGLVLNTNSLWDLKRVWRRMQQEGRGSPCFALLSTCEFERCYSTSRKFLQFLLNEGVTLLTPSEALQLYAKNNSDSGGGKW